MSLREDLMAVKEVIREPSSWCQLSSALDYRNKPVSALDDRACSFCLTGAIIAALDADGEKYMDVSNKLQTLLLGRSHVHFNDYPTTKHEDVIALLDAAISTEAG